MFTPKDMTLWRLVESGLLGTALQIRDDGDLDVVGLRRCKKSIDVSCLLLES